VLGTPIGHAQFGAWAEQRLQTEWELLRQLPKLPHEVLADARWD